MARKTKAIRLYKTPGRVPRGVKWPPPAEWFYTAVAELRRKLPKSYVKRGVRRLSRPEAVAGYVWMGMPARTRKAILTEVKALRRAGYKGVPVTGKLVREVKRWAPKALRHARSIERRARLMRSELLRRGPWARSVFNRAVRAVAGKRGVKRLAGNPYAAVTATPISWGYPPRLHAEYTETRRAAQGVVQMPRRLSIEGARGFLAMANPLTEGEARGILTMASASVATAKTKRDARTRSFFAGRGQGLADAVVFAPPYPDFPGAFEVVVEGIREARKAGALLNPLTRREQAGLLQLGRAHAQAARLSADTGDTRNVLVTSGQLYGMSDAAHIGGAFRSSERLKSLGDKTLLAGRLRRRGIKRNPLSAREADKLRDEGWDHRVKEQHLWQHGKDKESRYYAGRADQAFGTAARYRTRKNPPLLVIGNPLTVPEKHQLRVARRTLRMTPAMAGVMGGPTRDEAARVVRELDGKERGRQNPPLLVLGNPPPMSAAEGAEYLRCLELVGNPPLEADIERLRGELQMAHDRDIRSRYPEHADTLLERITVKPGKRWTKIDVGSSGAFMVDTTTGLVHGIKSQYGVPHPHVVHGPASKITGSELLPRQYARAHTPPIRMNPEGHRSLPIASLPERVRHHPHFDRAMRLATRFHHGSSPRKAIRYLIDDGNPGMRTQVLWATGRAPDTTYALPAWSAKGRKFGRKFVHEFRRMPLRARTADGRTEITLPGDHRVSKDGWLVK